MSAPPQRGRRNRFPKTARLRKRQDFLAIQRGGRRRATRHFLIVCSDNGGGPTRLGITVTRKVGNAVERNGVKRRVRELFRTHRAGLPAGADLVVIARKGAPGLDLGEARAEILPAMRALLGA